MSFLRHTPPYSCQYRFLVGASEAGMKIESYFTRRFSFKPAEYWRRLVEESLVTVNYGKVAPDYILKEKDIIRTQRNDVQEPDVNADYRVICNQGGLFIVDKPAPLPVHPAGRYNKNSLLHILREQFPNTQFHTIHRLDTWTTGVLVLATEREQARFLHRQVEEKAIYKVYGVMAVGDFGENEFVIDEVVGRVNGAQRGFGSNVSEPKESVTRFTPLVKKDGVTLLKAVPVTGRTNQIRLHVKAAGGYVLNDTLYAPQPTENVPFMGLHCRAMTFCVEQGGQPETFIAPWSEHFLSYFSEEDLARIEV